MKIKKIDPALMSVVQDFAEDGTAGLESHVLSLGLAHVDATSKPPSAVVFLNCSPTADFSHLENSGIVINQNHGAIRTGIVPVMEIESLSDEPAVKWIVASRKMRPLLDVAAKKV